MPRPAATAPPSLRRRVQVYTRTIMRMAITNFPCLEPGITAMPGADGTTITRQWLKKRAAEVMSERQAVGAPINMADAGHGCARVTGFARAASWTARWPARAQFDWDSGKARQCVLSGALAAMDCARLGLPQPGAIA